MADTNNKKEDRRKVKASKRSVEAALELLTTRTRKNSKRKRKEDKDDRTNKISSQCLINLVNRDEDTDEVLPMSEESLLSEMRSALLRRDWSSLCELFPLLLDCYSEIEPIIWRYALNILLCTPGSHPTYLEQFIDMCTGAATFDEILERLFTFQPR